jgi:endonuclease/exonuclease/phosphatase family metal-dependent hydrolase
MLTSIVTWNTQGRPDTNEHKNRVLDALCRTYNVVLLQECGSLFDRNGEQIAGKTIHCIGQAGAFNNRCSVAILADSVAGWDCELNASTGRAVVWVKRGGLTIGGIHATSGGVGMPDVKAGLKTLLGVAKDGPMVLGGDFNVDMDTDTTSINIGSVGRPEEFEVRTQDRPTHQGGGVLDHFATRNVELTGPPRVGQPSPSDHRYLTATFRWTPVD